MTLFRILVFILLAALVVYTILVIPQHGLNFFPVFIGGLMSIDWGGQIFLDFTTYLVLSGLWIAWRHDFSVGGILMAAVAAIGAMVVFAPYLLYASYSARGDVKVLLLGERRAKE